MSSHNTSTQDDQTNTLKQGLPDTTSEQADHSQQEVDLDTPIVRGNQIIKTVTLRKPKAGALRGLSIVALSQLDVNALQKLLPRISTPALTEADVANMEPEDLVALGVKVTDFLLQKEDRQPFQ